MILETTLVTEFDRWCPAREVIDQVAFPLGDRYPGEIFDNYFAWYGGLAKKYSPQRVLEIGVRYGYTAIIFALGATDGRPEALFQYVGVDDESYHYNSCGKANENFNTAIPGLNVKAIKHNSFNGIPDEYGQFDLIHVDGNHDYHGVMNDLNNVWGRLNVGGIIALDDTKFPCIRSAIEDFLRRFVDSPETVQVQWQDNERGHCYIRLAAE